MIPDLWARTERVAERALRRGALVPLGTTVETVEDGGFRFAVHVLGDAWRERPRTASAPGPAPNPFLPFDPELFVADVSPTHLALLNKFPVIDRHLLVVTRELVLQEDPLDRSDFVALWRALLAPDGPESLGFYNAGAAAGASQRHRHLQLVPLPLGGARSCTPFDAAFAAAGPDLGTLPGLRFPHLAARLPFSGQPSVEAAAAATHELHARALRLLGRDPASPGAYNLLVTRHFLCVVPRRREHYDSEQRAISVNALGFCGVLLAASGDELALLRAVGPMSVLAAVAG